MDHVSSLGTSAGTVDAPQPSRRRSHRGRHGRSDSRRRRNWLRPVYFGLASLWGYAMGAAALIAALAGAGQPVRATPLLVAAAAGGALVALVGGLLSSAAYRDARQRWS